VDAVRLFLAIDIPPRAREIITALQNRFKPLGFNASWVAPENVHLTLQFLGDTPSEQIPDIHQGVSAAVTPVPQFTVTLKKIGVFPKLKKPPRILWVGMEDPRNRLAVLQENIAKQMEEIGFPKEKRNFTPHLTLARIRQDRGGKRAKLERLKREVESSPEIEMESFKIDAVQLIESQLTPRGSVYTVLKEFPLGGQQKSNSTNV
jgi:2'-5' RNA ligase